MKNTILLCVLSSVLGSCVAIWLTSARPSVSRVAAQEPGVPTLVAPSPPPLSNSGSIGAATTLAQSPIGADDELTPEERVNVAVYENVNRSVVNITTESVATNMFFLIEVPSKGEGSGSVIDRQGHILTNFHVVEDAREINVQLWDGKSYPARLVGADPVSDVAVLKIDAPPESLFPLVIGDSTRLHVGQKVYAIGNPFGFERTMSAGIISSLNRTLPSQQTSRLIHQVIQIDASINPGNSGGPLLDSHGRLIGMNTAIASRTGSSVGLGFAIPASTISRVIPELLRSGRVTRPEVGIAKVFPTDNGLLIAALVPKGPAERAGLRGPRITTQRQWPGVVRITVDKSAADLIVGVDGQTTKTADAFLAQIESKRPGSQVVISVIRGGRRVDVPVTLGSGE